MTTIDWLIQAGTWTLRNSLEASLLFVFVWIIIRAGKNYLAPQVRIALWVVVGFRLFLPAAPESSWSLHNLLPDISPAAISVTVESGKKQSSPMKDAEMESGALSSQQENNPASSGQSFFWPFFLLWLGVFWALIVYVFISQFRMARWIRGLRPVADLELKTLAKNAGIPPEISIVEVPAGQGVAVFGLFRVTHLLLPVDFCERYSAIEIQSILRHESAHIQGKDLLWSWLLLFVQCWHWFNPMVWFAGSRIQAEREIICDRTALRDQPEANRPLYGSALTKALANNPIPEATLPLQTFLSRKNEMKTRLHLIMKKQSYQIIPQLGAIALTLALCLMTFTSALPTTSLADDNKPKAEGKRDPGAKAEAKKGGDKGKAKEGERDAKPAKVALNNTKEGKVFGAYDKDDDGFVTAKEMEAMKEGKQNSSARRQIRKAVKRADKDDDEKMSLKEFVWWYNIGRRNEGAENE